MPFCPQCRTEYRPGFARCSDCGAALVAERPAADPRDREFPMVKLAGFGTPAEAEMVKDILEQNGIPAFVRGGQADPIGVVSGAQQVALLVNEPDLERALEIYRAFFGQTGEGGALQD